MRSLKFRAWSEETKSFECFDLYEGTECGLTNLQIWARNNPIEQYTGLKDKNGKEIYEGDIVRDSKGEKCFIKWTESEAHFGLYVFKQMELTDFIWMRGEDLEVIGNIHENPELLEDEK